MAGTASTFTLKTNDGITTLVEQSVDTDESIVLDNGIIKFIDSSSVETTLYDLITNDYAGLSTTQGATTIDSGYGLDTTITLFNGGDQLGYTFYVVEQQEQDIAISLDNLTRYHNNLKVVLENLRLVAEGKCKALVISYLDTYSAIVSYLTNNPTKKVYLKSSGEDITNAFISGTGGLDQAISNPSFNTNDLSIPANIQGSPNLYFAAVKDENGDYYLYSLNPTIGADLNTGDLILVVETDVPDRWYDDTGYLYALETTKVDLTNYANLTSENTFTQVQNFKGDVNIGLDNAENPYLTIRTNQTNHGAVFRVYRGPDVITFRTNVVKPFNNTTDLGTSAYVWKEGFINKITDTNGSYSSDNVFNVINASDIVNNTLTQAQKDIITNGKPTILVGTNANTILMPPSIPSTEEYVGIAIVGTTGNWNSYITGYRIRTNLQFAIGTSSVQMEDTGRLTLPNVYSVNGKPIPAYPSNTGTFVNKMINGTWSWAQEWYGTQAEYDALGTYDSNTIYNILEN